MKQRMFLIACGLLCGIAARAQEAVPLSRDESGAYKKKLVGVLEAIGDAPAGYAKERENFTLPTEAYPARTTGAFEPVSAGVTRSYGTDKAVSRSQEDLAKDYQKRIADAQAKGDYEAISKMTSEMQLKMSQANANALSAHKEPVEVDIRLNAFGAATIDPDAVVVEKPGFIGLREKPDESSDIGTVTIYCDPVTLKDTKQLSAVRLQPPAGGMKKVEVRTIQVRFHGPLKEVEPWVKSIDGKKLLAQFN